jgi:hypothetical protein
LDKEPATSPQKTSHHNHNTDNDDTEDNQATLLLDNNNAIRSKNSFFASRHVNENTHESNSSTAPLEQMTMPLPDDVTFFSKDAQPMNWKEIEEAETQEFTTMPTANLTLPPDTVSTIPLTNDSTTKPKTTTTITNDGDSDTEGEENNLIQNKSKQTAPTTTMTTATNKKVTATSNDDTEED